MRHAHHDLSRVDDLAGLDQCFHDDAIGIRYQLRVAACITCNFGLGFGRIELGFGSICRRLDLIVGRSRYRTGSAQVAVTGFILRRLLGPRPSGGDRFLLSMHSELQIDRVDAHERLPALDGLPRIHEPFQYLAGDSETQIALHPSGDGPGERT